MFGFSGKTKLNASALGVAIAAATLLASGSAYALAQRPTLAQDPGACATGTHWRAVLPDNIHVTMPCPGVREQASFGHSAALRGAHAEYRGPLHTGSISSSKALTADRSTMVSGPQSCRAGAYWDMTNPNSTDKSTLVPCG